MSNYNTNNKNISLNINDFNNLDEMTESDILILEYIETLTHDEKKAMNIAKQHLETSFCIEKSNGFINWIKKRKLK